MWGVAWTGEGKDRRYRDWDWRLETAEELGEDGMRDLDGGLKWEQGDRRSGRRARLGADRGWVSGGWRDSSEFVSAVLVVE